MRLWSIQPEEVYNKLLQEKEYFCIPELSELVMNWGFGRPYDWMARQMKLRIGESPSSIKYPIWAWHTLYWKHEKPDLRRTEFRNYCGSQVCMELEIPDKEVLLSDEEMWHMVLNDVYYENALNEKESAKEDKWFCSLSVEEQLDVKEKSWEKIFDIAPFQNDWIRRGKFIQATFWKLELRQVVSARRFKGRLEIRKA